MDTIPEALTTNTRFPISIADLARLIEAPVENLRPLVEKKYLRVVFAREEFESTIVVRPGQRAIDWLKIMFQPLKMRPLIPHKEVGRLWKVTENHILKVCWAYRIPVYSDPVFGNLMTFNGLKSFARARMKYYKPKGYGQAALLSYYLSQIEGMRWKEPFPYGKKLSQEINRIARLPLAERTIQSVILWEAFHDAKTVAECLRRGREISEELRNNEEKVNELMRKATTGQWRSNSRALSR